MIEDLLMERRITGSECLLFVFKVDSQVSEIGSELRSALCHYFWLLLGLGPQR